MTRGAMQWFWSLPPDELPDSRLAAQDEHATPPGPRVHQQPVEHRAFPWPAAEHRTASLMPPGLGPGALTHPGTFPGVARRRPGLARAIASAVRVILFSSRK